jgi:polysaccharide pyruvyl transferase WcaK-like protein
MKIAFFLQTGTPNRGAEAIIRGFSHLLSKSSRHVDISLFSANPDEDKRANIQLVTENTIRKTALRRFSPLWFLSKIFNKLHIQSAYFNKACFYKHIFDCKNKFDLTVIVGADNYDVAYRSFEQMHELNKLFRNKITGKMLLYDCSIDEAYFEDKSLTEKLQADLQLFDAVTVREQVTLDNFQKHLSHKNMRYFPDPAFVMPVIETLLPNGWKTEKMTGVNLSNLIVRKAYGVGAEKIKAAYYYLIENILTKTDNNIVFIPHVMQGKDLGILTELYNKYKNTNRVLLIDNEKLFAPELKYIISQLRFLVTARTHASIAAYSTCVPTLVLGYSVKSKGIALDLFGTTEGYVVPVQELQNEKQLWNTFETIMAKEQEIKLHLQKIMPEYQNKLEKYFVPFINSVVK